MSVDLTFTVIDVVPEPYAADPQLTARLRIEEASGAVVHAMALSAQVRIEPQRRPYGAAEEGDLQGLFGGRDRWRDTLRPFRWMTCSSQVQGFTESTEVDLPMPCSYDFEVTGSKYLHALDGGTVPLVFLFSGTVFTRGHHGFGVERVPWNCEASFSLPVATWRRLIDLHFPGTGWLRLDRDLVEALARYQAEHGLTTPDAAVAELLAAARASIVSRS
ncbi:MAG: DUF6084 family protein [Propionibacteriaceae bacterium]